MTARFHSFSPIKFSAAGFPAQLIAGMCLIFATHVLGAGPRASLLGVSDSGVHFCAGEDFTVAVSYMLDDFKPLAVRRIEILIDDIVVEARDLTAAQDNGRHQSFTIHTRDIPPGRHSLLAKVYPREPAEAPAIVTQGTVLERLPQDGPILVWESPVAHPTDIAIEEGTGLLWVLDGGDTPGIVVLNPDDGTWVARMSVSAKTPQGITLGRNGGVYIADTGNGRILKYTRTPVAGYEIRLDPSFGRAGKIDVFGRPWGIQVRALDEPEDRIIVTDEARSESLVFNSKGKLRSTAKLISGAAPRGFQDGLIAYTGRGTVGGVTELPPGSVTTELNSGSVNALPVDVTFNAARVYIIYRKTGSISQHRLGRAYDTDAFHAIPGIGTIASQKSQLGEFTLYSGIGLTEPEAICTPPHPASLFTLAFDPLFVADTGNGRVVMLRVPNRSAGSTR